jgi:hypothetical protein
MKQLSEQMDCRPGPSLSFVLIILLSAHIRTNAAIALCLDPNGHGLAPVVAAARSSSHRRSATCCIAIATASIRLKYTDASGSSDDT